jgi:hypothetical protein
MLINLNTSISDQDLSLGVVAVARHLCSQRVGALGQPSARNTSCEVSLLVVARNRELKLGERIGFADGWWRAL